MEDFEEKARRMLREVEEKYNLNLSIIDREIIILTMMKFGRSEFELACKPIEDIVWKKDS